MSEADARAERRWAGRTLLLAVLFGLLAGLAELLLLAVKKYGQHRILHIPRDVVWMAPLADIVLCLSAGLLLIALAWRLPGLRGLRAAVTVTAFPAARGRQGRARPRPRGSGECAVHALPAFP
jgi:hypothetical protein